MKGKELKSLIIKNRNFRNIFLGNTVSQVGNLLFSFSIGFYLLGTDKPVTVFSAFIAYSFALELVLKLFSSVFAERFNKKKIVVFTDFFNGVLLLVCACFLFDSNNQITLINVYLIQTLLSLTNAFFSPAANTLMRLLVDDEDLQEMYALKSIIMKSKGILGVLIAASLFDIFGIRTIFVLNGISFTISAIMEMSIESNEKSKKEKLTFITFIKDIYDASKYVWSNKPVIEFTLVGTVSNLALIGFVPVFMKYFVYETLAFKTIFFSILQVTILSGQLIGGIYVSKRKVKPYKTFLWGTLLLASLFVVIGLAYQFIESREIVIIVNYIVFFIYGFTLSVINIPIVSQIMKKIDKSYFARSRTILNLFSSLTGPASMFLYGVFVDANYVGFSYVYIVVIVFVSFLMISKCKHMKAVDMSF